MILKFIKHKFCLICFFSIIFNAASAQLPDLKLVCSGSSTISTSIYNVDFTIGEVVTSSLNNTSNLFTIGYLQPNVVPAPAILRNNSNLITVFPVPAVNQINYLIDDPLFIPTTGQILSMSGNIIQSKTVAAGTITGQVFTFNLSGLSNGIYRIRFFNANGNIRSGQFIKL